MILGIGHDQVDIRRIAAAYQRFGARYLNRVYTADEQAYALAKSSPAATLAKRWAAKEATAKALGTGIGAQAFMREIEVRNHATGQPRLILHGRAQERLAQMCPNGHKVRLHVSLSDDAPYASAFVILEAMPEEVEEK